MSEKIRIGTPSIDEIIKRERKRVQQLLREARPPLLNVFKLIKGSWHRSEIRALGPWLLLYVQALATLCSAIISQEVERLLTGARPGFWWLCLYAILEAFCFAHLFWRGRWKRMHSTHLDRLSESNASQLLRMGLERDISNSYTEMLQPGESAPFEHILETLRKRLNELRPSNSAIPGEDTGYRESAKPCHGTDMAAKLSSVHTLVGQTKRALHTRYARLVDLAARVEAAYATAQRLNAPSVTEERSPTPTNLDEKISHTVCDIYTEIERAREEYNACLPIAIEALGLSYLTRPISVPAGAHTNQRALTEHFSSEKIAPTELAVSVNTSNKPT